ncbi:hypothetical protein ACEQ8H_006844 [Pleosporales sp. CAS-2024a]
MKQCLLPTTRIPISYSSISKQPLPASRAAKYSPNMFSSFQKVLVFLFAICCAVSARQQPELPLCAVGTHLSNCYQYKHLPILISNSKPVCSTLSRPGFVLLQTRPLATQNYSLRNCGAPIRNRGAKYVALSNVMVSLAGAFVLIRFVFKLVVSKLELGLDDWAVLACLGTTIPSATVTVHGTVKHGLGQDIWTLSPHEITTMLKYFLVMACLYFTQVALLKLTLLFFYICVFPGRPAQRLLWGTVAFVVIWGALYVLLAIFQCQPISFFWTRWDGLHEGHCLNINAITASNAGISIALDLWILAIPLWQLYGLKMHWKKKVGVAVMFAVGTFVTVVSCLRMVSVVQFAQSTNASWEFYDVSVWSSVEITVGIMCACLPTMRLLLVKIFPVLGGSTARSRNQYYNYGSGTELKNMGASANSRNQRKHMSKTGDSSTSPSPNSLQFPPDHGITVKTSYTMERRLNDTDDQASLVSHENDKK